MRALAARQDRGRAIALILAVPPVLFLAIFFLYPVASILALGLAPEGRPEVNVLGRLAGTPYLGGVLWFTLWQAVVSTVLTVALALPAAYVLARYEFPGKRLVRALALVPFVLPTIVVASAFLALLGARSPLNGLLAGLFGSSGPQVRLEHTIWAILAAHVFYNYAVVLRVVGGLWSHLDPRPEEAARMLGAGPWRVFRDVTLPLLRPAIASAASIVFLFTLTSFGVVLLLGGPSFATLEVEIYRQTSQVLDLQLAAGLCVIQIVGVLALVALYGGYAERVALRQRLRPPAEVARRPRNSRERAVVAVTVGSMLLALGAPLIVLVERSLAGPAGYGLGFYSGLWQAPRGSSLFVPPIEAVSNSLAFAAVAAFLATVLGITAAIVVAYRRGWFARSLDVLLMLPLGTSAVIVGFGFIVALDTPPLDLRSSWFIIPIAHTLVALPFVVRAAVPLMRSVDERIREAARVLGASPRRAWREVDAPMVGRAAAVGAGFAFAVSLGEFGATLFIARPDVPTLPIAVFRLLARPGALEFGEAMAMSTLLMLVTGASVLLIERLRGDTSSAF